MPEFEVLEPAIDPNNRITFLLDWELTLKCNLDCSYCDTGLYGGHDNSTKHPPVTECLNTVDFMFEYVNEYMLTRPRGLQYVVLNVYGGESLHHPDIIKILEYIRQAHKKYSWSLTVTTTTNAIVTEKKLNLIIPYIDEFTVSYHTTNTQKQKNQFKNNLLVIKKAGVRQKCVVLMHSEPDLFADATSMIDWLTENDIKHFPKQLDHSKEDTQFNHSQKQITWFKQNYTDNSYNNSGFSIEPVLDNNNQIDLADTGRTCCGGRQFCTDKQYGKREYFVENKFPDWFCSVNHYFLHIKQVNGEIFVNKDCKMNYNGTVGPIGLLSDTKKLLSYTREQLTNKTLPVIQCKKSRCLCGLCAPKAATLEQYNSIMKKYQL